MGITWIFEDSQEAVYSNTEVVPPPGGRVHVQFSCPFCSAFYPDFPSMQRHASSEHRLQRPVLLWNKHEVGADRKIMSAGVFAVTNSTSAFFSVDGAAEKPISTDDLTVLLGLAVDSLIRVRLENRPHDKMAPASSAYRLEFRIADEHSLAGVEKAFRQHVVQSTPTPDTIRMFLEDSRCMGLASEYATGLYAYVHALLLKERLSDGGLYYGYLMHPERFGEALQRLEQVDRKLASTICMIVRLMRNDISDGGNGSSGDIAIASSMLRGPGATTSARRPRGSKQIERLCPIDHGTSRVIALACRLADAERWSDLLEDECRSFAANDLLPMDDRRKALAYWAVTAMRLRNRRAARYPLQQIANIYPFEAWAAQALAENDEEIE